MPYDLAVVMPIYNEEGCIVDVIQSWSSILSKLQIDFQIIAINDGSKDHTKNLLNIFSMDEHVEVVHKKNSGHGPTILIGYKMAVECADWVFQCDSDDEMKADHFPKLWEKRCDYDALFGTRAGRYQNLSRKIISFCSRLTVRLLFGTGVSDVNTAYRLMRSNILKQIIAQIPDDVFAPNVIISGALSRGNARIYEYPVPIECRKTGTVSIAKWKLWKSAFKAFFQILCCRPDIKVTGCEDCTGGEREK